MSAEKKAKVNKINPSFSGTITPSPGGYRSSEFTIRVGSLNAEEDFHVMFLLLNLFLVKIIDLFQLFW